MNLHISMPEVTQIRQELKSLEEAALDGTSVPDLRAAINPTMLGYITYTSSIGGPIYRGRKAGDGAFSRISELWYPPDQLTPQGRANEAGKPVFYCSDHHHTVTRELSPNKGETIVVLECNLRDANKMPNVFCIGASRQAIRTGTTIFGKRIDQKFGFGSLPKPIRQATLLVDSFLSRVFRSNGKAYFNLTNAISLIYLSSDKVDGLVYPSVAPGGSKNMVLKAASVDFLYEPRRVFEAKVEHVFGPNKLIMRCTNTANVERNGLLKWDAAR